MYLCGHILPCFLSPFVDAAVEYEAEQIQEDSQDIDTN